MGLTTPLSVMHLLTICNIWYYLDGFSNTDSRSHSKLEIEDMRARATCRSCGAERSFRMKDILEWSSCILCQGEMRVKIGTYEGPEVLRPRVVTCLGCGIGFRSPAGLYTHLLYDEPKCIEEYQQEPSQMVRLDNQYRTLLVRDTIHAVPLEEEDSYAIQAVTIGGYAKIYGNFTLSDVANELQILLERD